ncbi:hypothetical protein B0A48_06802 [Cryoendolithus antarcticus]|uniref:SPIN90/Ldb17 leucine-rich domain-containing protein n=1 Tax=Cryoendolithus antarcticus TaxID=1507870 RepID=A0A1V8T9I0_9PEZI|nr:hypothetical protein B0A48_06802 [Cryoendolithus antarcticus]
MDISSVSNGLENEQQFWEGLEKIFATDVETYEHIDDTLRAFLDFAATHKQKYLLSEYEYARYVYMLLDSSLFAAQGDYIRRQILYCLLQDDDVDTLHLSAAIFLFDGRSNETAFEMMLHEGAFTRLAELIRDRKDDHNGLHRLMLELMSEMARIQKLKRDDLATIDDTFVLDLFKMIEQLSDDAEDPFHYPIIRVLLVLNEQYMCFANEPSSPEVPSTPMTNRVLKLLSLHGPLYRTFGENLILLLNRETSLGPQLLILKLLYLLFTTTATFEYFYTNDLHVLVDVVVRNLLDLDSGCSSPDKESSGDDADGQTALRHTYLRVLCPLLKNTQLAREGNHYKREEVRRTLYLLIHRSSAHFAPVDATVVRLALRIKQIEWLHDEGDEQEDDLDRKLAEVAPTETLLAQKLLGMSVTVGGESSLSVHEVSSKMTKVKPSVPAPRRKRTKNANGEHMGASGANHGSLEVPVLVQAHVSGERSPFADDSEERRGDKPADPGLCYSTICDFCFGEFNKAKVWKTLSNPRIQSLCSDALRQALLAAGPEQGVILKREDDCEKNSTIAGPNAPAPPYGGYSGYSPPPYGPPTGWHTTGGIPVTSTSSSSANYSSTSELRSGTDSTSSTEGSPITASESSSTRISITTHIITITEPTTVSLTASATANTSVPYGGPSGYFLPPDGVELNVIVQQFHEQLTLHDLE